MKPIYSLLLAALMLVGCHSGQKQTTEQTPAASIDKQKEELVIRQLVNDVYKDINARWDKSSDSTVFVGTLEENYTTKEWQQMYLELRAIETAKVAAGKPNDMYFSENGNVWTMGSTDLPFTAEIVRVEFANATTADVYFWLNPTGGEKIPILWKLKKADDRWWIQNFLEGDEAYDYEYDYMEHMKDYIRRNS